MASAPPLAPPARSASGAGTLAAARLCVSALSGGGGKTLLSLGLARALTARGQAVQPFKKGPDYIDAAWLALAAGAPAHNLDPFFLPADRLRALVATVMERAAPGALALVEGNRGLFDGLDAQGSCATSVLARALACPVLLSLDCTKMTRTAAAVVHGVLAFEPGLRFAGIVLNQVGSARHERLLRQALERHTDAPVLGALPRLTRNPLPERHMGIRAPGDIPSAETAAMLDKLGALVADHVDMDAILAAAGEAPPLDTGVPFWPTPAAPDGPPARRPRVGYVHDAALWFYYEENLEALERAGAALVRLSLLDAAAWPEDLDALYLGGGFPEDCAARLSASPHPARVAAMARAGLPVYAECGGFMALTRGIETAGRLWPMGGLFPVTAQCCGKPQGLGYVRATVATANPYFPVGMTLAGHEFHYSRCRWGDARPPCALRLARGQGLGPAPDGDGPRLDGLLHAAAWGSYTHIFAPAVPCWAPNLVAAARRHAAGKCPAGTGNTMTNPV